MPKAAGPELVVSMHPCSDSRGEDRQLLPVAAAALLGLPLAAVEISRSCADCGGDHGRPTVVGGGAWVSLSRCGGLIAIAASRTGPVGVDIESISAARSRPLDAVTAAEREIGSAAELWAAKEAILKADGRGLRCDPRGLVLCAAAEGMRIGSWPDARVPLDSVDIRTFVVDADIVGAVAVFGRPGTTGHPVKVDLGAIELSSAQAGASSRSSDR